MRKSSPTNNSLLLPSYPSLCPSMLSTFVLLSPGTSQFLLRSSIFSFCVTPRSRAYDRTIIETNISVKFGGDRTNGVNFIRFPPPTPATNIAIFRFLDKIYTFILSFCVPSGKRVKECIGGCWQCALRKCLHWICWSARWGFRTICFASAVGVLSLAD